MQSPSVSRNFAQCLDAITLSVMYSFKKVPVTEYNFRSGNSQTPRSKSLKKSLLFVKVNSMKSPAETTNIDVTLITKVNVHVNTSGWGNQYLIV